MRREDCADQGIQFEFYFKDNLLKSCKAGKQHDLICSVKTSLQLL